MDADDEYVRLKAKVERLQAENIALESQIHYCPHCRRYCKECDCFRKKLEEWKCRATEISIAATPQAIVRATSDLLWEMHDWISEHWKTC